MTADPHSAAPRRPDAVLIAGPTASGKSAVALAIAEACGGAVVNADSMQVYRELRILTARPAVAEEARAPHLLYGHVGAAEGYSVARWLKDAEAAMAGLRARGLMPVIVGGTGLYFKALTEGLSPVPDVPAEIRAHWRAEAARIGGPALHAVLRKRDPDMARALRPGDAQRVARALEVIEATGRSLSAWRAVASAPLLRLERCLPLLLHLDRDALHRRCESRFEAMLAAGALEEARRVMRLGLDAAAPAMGAIGLAPLTAHIKGEISLDEAALRAKADTRRYAKRQLTWFRKHMIAWKRVEAQQMERTESEINEIIKKLLDPPLSPA